MGIYNLEWKDPELGRLRANSQGNRPCLECRNPCSYRLCWCSQDCRRIWWVKYVLNGEVAPLIDG